MTLKRIVVIHKGVIEPLCVFICYKPQYRCSTNKAITRLKRFSSVILSLICGTSSVYACNEMLNETERYKASTSQRMI